MSSTSPVHHIDSVSVRGAGMPGVWVDESHPILRRGIVASLIGAGWRVDGESSRLHQRPSTGWRGIVIFEADPENVRRIVGWDRNSVRLVGMVRAPAMPLLFAIADLGVAGILLNEELTSELLIATVSAVARGRIALPPDVLPRLLAHAAERTVSSLDALTMRERQVLQLLSQGEDTRAIAAELCYSERTVKNVVHDVLTKLNCRTRAQAVGVAARSG